jgi:hypothetical protein
VYHSALEHSDADVLELGHLPANPIGDRILMLTAMGVNAGRLVDGEDWWVAPDPGGSSGHEGGAGVRARDRGLDFYDATGFRTMSRRQATAVDAHAPGSNRRAYGSASRAERLGYELVQAGFAVSFDGEAMFDRHEASPGYAG